MSRFRLYYDFESMNRYVSYKDSSPLTSMTQVYNLIREIENDTDIISIYDLRERVRLQIFKKDDFLVTLEIHNSSLGTSFFREFNKDEMLKMPFEFLSEFIKNPIDNMFRNEKF